jgi:hypothetical protein
MQDRIGGTCIDPATPEVVGRAGALRGLPVAVQADGVDADAEALRDVVAIGDALGQGEDVAVLGMLRDRIAEFVDAGFSKLVLVAAEEPASWPQELETVAAAVLDLQT